MPLLPNKMVLVNLKMATIAIEPSVKSEETLTELGRVLATETETENGESAARIEVTRRTEMTT